MTPHSTIIIFAILTLAAPIACTASKVATPSSTTLTIATTSTPTATEESPYVVPLIPDIPKWAVQKQHSKHSICHPIPRPIPWDNHRNPDLPNFFYYNVRGYWAHENYIRWSPDGSSILFDVPNEQNIQSADLYRVAADGSLLNKIVDTSAERPDWLLGGSMMYFDVSPDGSRLAFSACAHNRIPEVTDVRPGSWPRGWRFDYDVVLANIDGTGVQRLTATPSGENFPIWSPDGSSVAYISSLRYVGTFYYMFNRGVMLVGRLTVHNTATGETSDIHLPTIEDRIAPHPPAWSPDGQKLAFVVYEGNLDMRDRPFTENPVLRPVVWIVGVDGTGLARITEAASGPAWSPDGQRIAVAVPVNETNADLYTFASDGSDPVLVETALSIPWDYPVKPWQGNLSWSSDGSAILLEGYARIVSLDGSHATSSGLSNLTQGYQPIRRMLAAWSPDGSRVAIRTEDPEKKDRPAVLVYVMDRDGSNARILVEAVYSDQEEQFDLRLAQ